MRKRDGFTLIELLAVIVILAVIALIAVPRIIEILNKSRLSAAEDSTMGIVEAAESYVASFMLKNHGIIPSEDLIFECNGTGCHLKTTLNGYNIENLTSLEFKGKKPTSGTITVSGSGNKVEAKNLKISGYNCNYQDEKVSCVDDIIEPVITIKENYPVVTSNSIIIGYKIEENGSGIKSVTCKYGENKDNLDKEVKNATKSECAITNLDSEAHIYYEVCVIDNGENKTNPCLTGEEVVRDNYISSNNIIRYNYDAKENTETILKNLAGNSTYDGEIYNATYTNDGLLFNGTNSYVAIGEFNPENLTVEVTVKLNNITTDEQIIIANFEGGGFGIIQRDLSLIGQAHIDNKWHGLLSSQSILNTNSIYNLTLSYDGTIMKFYINGILQDTYVSSSGIKKPDNNTWLFLGNNPGGHVAGSSGWFNGSIYSVRTYDRALTDGEINHNYMIDKTKYLIN